MVIVIIIVGVEEFMIVVVVVFFCVQQSRLKKVGVVYLSYQFRSRAAHQSKIKDAFYKYVSIDWKTPAEAITRNITGASVF
jgi:hypothetical protein